MLSVTTLHHIIPRAVTGHKACTTPLRTQTNQSCRFTVGSQCPGTSSSFSPSVGGVVLAATLCWLCKGLNQIWANGSSRLRGNPIHKKKLCEEMDDGLEEYSCELIFVAVMGFALTGAAYGQVAVPEIGETIL